MCVICVSKKGVRQPTTEEITNMWNRNPNGGGYMFINDAGKVEYHKGFLKLSDFIKAIQSRRFTDDDVVCYHFRISTQAFTPEMTHPFPLVNDIKYMKTLDATCNCAVMHNGIIQMTSNGNKEYSDTALFISNYLSRLVKNLNDLKDPYIITMIEELTNSKLAIMDRSGYVALAGKWIDKGGLLFSNDSYKGSCLSLYKNWIEEDDEDYCTTSHLTQSAKRRFMC